MKMLYLKPAEKGRIVRDPRNGKPLPDGGDAVPDTSYWRRRLMAGDVKKTTAEAVKKAAAERAKVEQAKADKGKAEPAKEG
jgi:hypothetical protein